MTRSHEYSDDMFDKHPLNDVAGLWGLRILLNLNGLSGLSSFCLTNDGDILRTYGMGDLEGSDIEKKEFAKKLREKQAWYEQNNPNIEGILKKNLTQFGRLVGLSKSELQILGFSVVIHSHRGLENTADTLGNLNGSDIVRYLSIILKLPVKKVQRALDSKSVLSSSGVLSFSKNGNTFLRNKLDLMRGLADILQEPQTDMLGMVRNYFTASNDSKLFADDYAHISVDYRLITKYLSKAAIKNLPGVNILVYGRPGTGKSELVKTMANELDFNLYEISVSDRDGDALTGNNRFSSYQLCQKILARQKKSLVLFDEVEDVFPASGLSLFGITNSGDRRKAWVNRLLEDNPVPAVWISNNIKQIDNAFIRRFDFVLKLDHPPKENRSNILSKHFSDLSVSNQWIESVAENPNIAPALVSRAARIASNIDIGDNNIAETEHNLERIMGNTLEAMGYSEKVCQKQKTVMSYRLDALNPDVDIHKLVKGLKHSPEGRICLYGPPGTGKTEFGRYVARALEKPLIVKRASDLLGPYVGMTEKNIADMYTQAQEEDSVLLLDEADSFLRDRNAAQHNWEVTQVNEMLTQMEDYEGIFICSTNLVDNLDSASLRRFDFKIYFDYLKANQSWILFKQILRDQGQVISAKCSLKNDLSRLNNLTPGDFATVVRQNRLCNKLMDANLLLTGLSRESGFKQTNISSGIGFTAAI